MIGITNDEIWLREEAILSAESAFADFTYDKYEHMEWPEIKKWIDELESASEAESCISKIKYKVWDKANKKFVDSCIDQVSITFDGNVMWRSHEGIEVVNAHFEIFQYSMVSDKDRADIYEGDILSNGMVKPVIGVVIIRKGRFEIKLLKNSCHKYANLYVESFGLSVIGNIKENPELIPGGK